MRFDSLKIFSQILFNIKHLQNIIIVTDFPRGDPLLNYGTRLCVSLSLYAYGPTSYGGLESAAVMRYRAVFSSQVFLRYKLWYAIIVHHES